MARAKIVHSVLPLGLTVLDRALLSYYARKLNTDQAKVVRAMVREFVRRDIGFDEQAFRAFVQDEFTEQLEAGAARDLRRRLASFSHLGRRGSRRRQS